MKRHLAVTALFAIFLVGATAARAADSDKPAPIKIILHPSPEAVPALKYQLLPPLLDRRPGNAAVHYLKVPHEQTALFADRAFWETMSNWAEMPLPELRKDAAGAGKKYAWITGQSSGIIEMLERGGRCESCDWDIPIREHEFYTILLPDIQSMRSSGWILAARARLEIADRKYDDAIRTLKTGYALARHVSQAPTLINGLVGVSIATEMSNQVETLLQQPDSPNLYWALATLPRPLIDFRYGFDGELASIYLTYPELRDLDKKDYSPDEWRRLLQKLCGEIAKIVGVDGGAAQFQSLSMGGLPSMLEGYPRAKRFLISQGRSAAEVEAMPVPQVILLYTTHTYEELRDDTFKWMSLTYPEARKGLEQANDHLKKAHAEGREIIPLATMLLPAIYSVKQADARMSQKIAALEVVEALRIYAAAHDARLPESLSDISEVPVPLDPFRGEPFQYVRDGNSAKLESPFPSQLPLRYEIRLVKQGAKP
jgi:hypothetical protein